MRDYSIIIVTAMLVLSSLSGCSSKEQSNPSKTAKSGSEVASPVTPTLMRTETTVREYAACVSAGACSEPKTIWKTCNWSGRQNRLDQPVNCVDWNQATAYCKWSGSRLPTEDEWAAAAKGIDEKSAEVCASRDATGTCPAGSHPKDANPSGILDLLANVKEWTDTTAMLPLNVEARVIRGAGWQIDPLAAAPESGLTNRETLKPSEVAADLGFRCMSVPR